MIAIPFGVFKLHYPGWLTVVAGVPFAYVQVIAIDLAWSWLSRLGWFNRLLLDFLA